ncbi:PREDICTED: integrator complex subunit 7-like [Amphimedon queenslandica]|uniref:Integrator complex subunit 7 N-terminal domain-containing protein n=1 Tax=Amphimedon queenslandica TaxID=400682 RepID=A0AAN0K217_AMPQE|nr:PREDICTED: integrator complex subunit 7-like [Amphimedon queenslandica]|eukprot:XP_019863319.1 PREDICTED: integrator complex subunit 7-like [Amphimedon queenslandica]
MARALTLRLFACISTIIADKKAVHHSVWRGLESNYTVEVEAAIKATDSLCQHSSDFAVGVYDKVAAIVKGIRVTPEMKLKVITVMKRMNHTLAIAKQVRDVCIQLLSTHSSTPFIITILTTLTELCLSVIVQIPEQIVLLLDFAAQDPRRLIRMHSLNKLYRVTIAHPHYWDSNNVEVRMYVHACNFLQILKVAPKFGHRPKAIPLGL